MMSGRSSAAALVAVLILTATHVAWAQDDQRARVHFEAGRAYFEEGAYERALQEFSEAYELSQRDVMLWNIGTTQERLAMYAEAADSFERYLANVEEVPNRAILERRIVNLRERVRREEAGETVEDEPPLEDDSTELSDAEDTPPPETTDGGGDGLLIGGVAALAVGGVAGITAAIAGGLALAAQSSVESGCFADRTCTPDDVAEMDTLALVTDVMWPIALVAAGVGAVLVALGATSGSEDQAALRVVPFAGPTTAGLVARGGF